MPRLPTLFLIITGSFFAGALAYGIKIQSRRSSEQDLARQAKDFLRERSRLDDTVWSKEVVAQAYESGPIRLWDELRAAEDKWAVVEEAPFAALSVGLPSGTRGLAEGVTITKYAEAGKSPRSRKDFTRAAWKVFLKGLQGQGWNLIQGEIHHKRFEGSGEADAHSVFSFVAHLERQEPRARRMVEGQIEVHWTRDKDDHGNYLPGDVRTLEFAVKDREGPPAFHEVMNQVPEAASAPKSDLAPLLVHDLDGDGDAEILLPALNVVYWNDGIGGLRRARLLRDFAEREDKTVTAAVLTDLDGDGEADLFLAREGLPPLLYQGSGAGRFQEAPREVQIPGALWHSSLAIAAGDVDGDHDSDLWVTQYRIPYGEGRIPVPYYDANDSEPAYLLLNDGEGNFKDGTEASGLSAKRYRRTYAASFVDLDDDGDLDLVESSDFAGVDLFENNGKGRFMDAAGAVDQSHTFGMGQAFGDFNGDGLLDIYAVGMGSTTAYRLEAMGLGRPEFPENQKMRTIMGYGNRLLLAEGPPGSLGEKGRRFRQASYNDQVSRTGWSWGVAALDYDLDGDQDLYVMNGHSSGSTARDYCTTFWTQDIYPSPGVPQKARDWALSESVAPLRDGRVSWNPFEHKFLLTNGPAAKVKVTPVPKPEKGRRKPKTPEPEPPPAREFVNLGFLMDAGFEFDGRCLAAEDLDLDGRPDLVLTEEPLNKPGRLHVLLNALAPMGRWIGVRVKESPGSPALGARITVSAGGRTFTQVVAAGDSFRTQQGNSKVFGLGRAKRVDWIEVRRPYGSAKRLEHPEAGQYYEL